MKTLSKGWNFIRVFRLVLGMVILVQGIVLKDTLSIILGLVFGGMAIWNIGCCGANQCVVNTPSESKTKRIHDEELDFKK